MDLETDAASAGQAIIRGITDQGTSKISMRGSETLLYLDSGKVGIGNTNPPEALTVTGDISGSSHFRLSPTKRVIFDQGTSHTYLLESSNDNLRAVVGGTNVLDITTTKISGSSSSTGSFGSVHVVDKVRISNTTDAELS